MKEWKFQQQQGMVDISAKATTKRVAKACATIQFSKEAFQALRQNKSPKGDVFETARIAGIMAAKSTSNIIPLCHPLDIKKVSVAFAFSPQKNSVAIHSEVICLGQTGVEMEALTAVSVAALTIYDMMKWAGKGMVIKDIRLLYKSGGKSGEYKKS